MVNLRNIKLYCGIKEQTGLQNNKGTSKGVPAQSKPARTIILIHLDLALMRKIHSRGFLFNEEKAWDYPLDRWLESNGENLFIFSRLFALPTWNDSRFHFFPFVTEGSLKVGFPCFLLENRFKKTI